MMSEKQVEYDIFEEYKSKMAKEILEICKTTDKDKIFILKEKISDIYNCGYDKQFDF